MIHVVHSSFFTVTSEVTEMCLAISSFAQYVGEPAEVAREKERERHAGREALKACGFMAEEQRYALQRLCP